MPSIALFVLLLSLRKKENLSFETLTPGRVLGQDARIRGKATTNPYVWSLQGEKVCCGGIRGSPLQGHRAELVKRVLASPPHH